MLSAMGKNITRCMDGTLAGFLKKAPRILDSIHVMKLKSQGDLFVLLRMSKFGNLENVKL